MSRWLVVEEQAGPAWGLGLRMKLRDKTGYSGRNRYWWRGELGLIHFFQYYCCIVILTVRGGIRQGFAPPGAESAFVPGTVLVQLIYGSQMVS